MAENKIVISTYAESEGGLTCAYRMAESIRTFGRKFADSTILLFLEESSGLLDIVDSDMLEKFRINLHTFTIPEPAKWFYLSGKVYSNAAAEKLADKRYDVLVYLDNDTVLINEPADFDLEDNIAFKYVPVTHNRTGVLYEAEPGPFWYRAYKLLKINRPSLFAMVSPADGDKIKAYFHAGILVVRPERRILRTWVEDYQALYEDERLAQMCHDDINWRVFIHQAALVGLLNHVERDEMIELSDKYNYNIFFEKKYGGTKIWDDISDVVTVRCIIGVNDLPANWDQILKGDRDTINWIKERY